MSALERANFYAIGNDPLHRLFSLSQLSSYVTHNLRRPQDSPQSPLPTKEILANTSSPGFAGFVTRFQMTLDEGKSCSPPRAPGQWDAGHHKGRPGPGVRTCSPLGIWRPLVCHPPLVILNWHMQGKYVWHILYTWYLAARCLIYPFFLASCQEDWQRRLPRFPRLGSTVYDKFHPGPGLLKSATDCILTVFLLSPLN